MGSYVSVLTEFLMGSPEMMVLAGIAIYAGTSWQANSQRRTFVISAMVILVALKLLYLAAAALRASNEMPMEQISWLYGGLGMVSTIGRCSSWVLLAVALFDLQPASTDEPS